MGHTRLGKIPKTRKWRDVLGLLSGPPAQAAGTRFVSADVAVIASRALTAGQSALERASHDPGVSYTFYLLTQVALASRGAHWGAVLGNLGIRLPDDGSLLDLTAEIQGAVDRHLAGLPRGGSDISEMAQQAAGESITSLLGARTATLFGTSSAELQGAVRSLSTKKGFGDLGQKFFGRFLARFLNFYVSRVTASALGGPRFQQLGDVAQFNEALKQHCDQSARIVRDFCGEWYSKTEYEEGINPANVSRFLAVALRKLKEELQQQRAET